MNTKGAPGETGITARRGACPENMGWLDEKDLSKAPEKVQRQEYPPQGILSCLCSLLANSPIPAFVG